MFTNSKDITTELTETISGIQEAISLFSEQSFNEIPFEGSWTCGQVAEHVYLSVKDIPNILLVDTVKTDRAPDEYVEQIKSIFLDLTTKMKSPEFIKPTDKPKDKAFFLKEFEELAQKLAAVIDMLDLSETCTSFSFPGVGLLTRLELICFAICHTYRHTKQMNKIHKVLSEKA